MDRRETTRCTFHQILVGIHIEAEALCLQVLRGVKRCLLISPALLSRAEAATGQVSGELGLANRHTEVLFPLFAHLSRLVVDIWLVILPRLNRVKTFSTSGIRTEVEWLKARVYHITTFGHGCPVSTQVLTLVIAIVHANNWFFLRETILGWWANLELDRQSGCSWLSLLLLLRGLLIHILRRWLLKLLLQFVN